MGVTTAILGASGYSGQETLDRVLSHPELELVALGSDSLAGQPASALDPRLNGEVPRSSRMWTRSRPAQARLLVSRPRAGGRARAASRHRRRRPLGRAPADRACPVSGVVRLRAPAFSVARRLGLRHPGALRAARLADREPRLLRHRRAARARASLRGDRPGLGDRGREVRRLRRRAGVEGLVARDDRAGERLALQDRLAPACARDRADARLPGLLRPHLLRSGVG
jgi:hypothetical protein